MKYIGTYKVFRLYNSGKRVIIERGLTRDEAKRVVARSESSNTSMVCFDKQFTAEKYYV